VFSLVPTYRKLAAIMLADIQGYSGLMEQDEAGTFERMRCLREELVIPAVDRFDGRIVKTTGDGFLAEFASARAAVQCGIEIQRLNIEREIKVEDSKRLHLRIGLNLGDIIVDGDDVSGDGVNIAARLEAIAQPDGICLSAAIRDQIRDNLGVDIEDLGERKLKNISRSIQAYHISLQKSEPNKLKKFPKKLRFNRRHIFIAILLSLTILIVSGSPIIIRYMISDDGPDIATGVIEVGAIKLLDARQDLSTLAQLLRSDIVSRLSEMKLVAATTENQNKPMPEFTLNGEIVQEGDQYHFNMGLRTNRDGLQIWTDRFVYQASEVSRMRSYASARSADVIACALDFRARETKMSQPLFRLFVQFCATRWHATDSSGIIMITQKMRSCPREWCKSDVIVELSGEVGRLIVRLPRRAA
jgi:class 3 adenylate cyclase